MYFRVTFSIPSEKKRVYDALMEYKSKGGNVSGLIVWLLDNYFFGNLSHDTISKEIVKISELESKYEKLIQDSQKYLEELRELKKQFEKKQEIHEAENDARLITLLKDTGFDDMEYLKQKHSNKQIVELATPRLRTFAHERKISLDKAWQLFYRAFPELEEG